MIQILSIEGRGKPQGWAIGMDYIFQINKAAMGTCTSGTKDW